MSGYEKFNREEMFEFHPESASHEADVFGGYPPSAFGNHGLYTHGLDSHIQEADFQYVPAHGFNPRAFEHDGKSVVPNQARPASTLSSFSTAESIPAKKETVPVMSRKRRASPDSEYESVQPAKKLLTAHVQVQDPNGDYYDFSGQTSPYSAYVPTPTASAEYHGPQPAFPSPRLSGHQHSTSTASQVSLAGLSPHTPAWSPSFATVKTEQSPQPPMTPIPRPATSSPLKSSNPRLVRTSTIHSPAVGSVMSGSNAQNFNPYAMYPLKANLKLKGDLDSMTKDWSSDEVDAHRRLVEFKRNQSGSTIAAHFKPVSPQERAPSSITISCILWKEKKEYFVTSVDTIYLLEALVGVRFTVEEKNRIRRNLEGFRPLTVSKSKADSEEFFKVIMGFPHPKPRNIEKDVKVFPWKILTHALKKIISKYSASYSSTASALLTPAAPSFTHAEVPVEYGYPPSPRTQMVRSAQPTYQAAPLTPYYPAPMPRHASAPLAMTAVPELQLQVPSHEPAYGMPEPYDFNMPGMPQASVAMMSQTLSAPAGRMHPQWEYGHVLQDGVSPAGPASAPPIAYPRGMVDTADFGSPLRYPMN